MKQVKLQCATGDLGKFASSVLTEAMFLFFEAIGHLHGLKEKMCHVYLPNAQSVVVVAVIAERRLCSPQQRRLIYGI